MRKSSITVTRALKIIVFKSARIPMKKNISAQNICGKDKTWANKLYTLSGKNVAEQAAHSLIFCLIARCGVIPARAHVN